MTVHVLRVPAPDKFLNSNQRLHWAVKAKLTKAWRDSTLVHARKAKLPKGLGKVHIVAEIHKAGGGRWDVGNLQPTLKACVDGLVDYGLVVDDSNEYVIGPDARKGDPGRAAVTITITELTPQ